MTDGTLDFMGFEPHTLQLTAPIAEVVSKWLRAKYPLHTTKMVARDLGSDIRTAENVVNGHLSSVNLTKLIRAHGWSFLAAVGAAVIGETYESSITRELEEIADDRRDLEAREGRLRGSYARLRARRSVGPGGLHLVPEEDPGASREDRRFG